MMTTLSRQGRAAKLRKDRQKNAKPTKVHTPSPKRTDVFDGVVYDDWFEQDIAELVKEDDELDSD